MQLRRFSGLRTLEAQSGGESRGSSSTMFLQIQAIFWCFFIYSGTLFSHEVADMSDSTVCNCLVCHQKNIKSICRLAKKHLDAFKWYKMPDLWAACGCSNERRTETMQQRTIFHRQQGKEKRAFLKVLYQEDAYNYIDLSPSNFKYI